MRLGSCGLTLKNTRKGLALLNWAVTRVFTRAAIKYLRCMAIAQDLPQASRSWGCRFHESSPKYLNLWSRHVVRFQCSGTSAHFKIITQFGPVLLLPTSSPIYAVKVILAWARVMCLRDAPSKCQARLAKEVKASARDHSFARQPSFRRLPLTSRRGNARGRRAG